MILAVFGTIYAVCLAILALVFLSAKPLPPLRRRARDDERERANATHRTPQGHGRELVATHH